MRLSNFIIGHLDEILVEWVAFARSQLPAAANLDKAALLDHGKLILAVENTGKPIPKRLLPTLFDPLVRAAGEDWDADSPVAGANLGLGLCVVREIAIAHGGTVEVTSDEDATRFELRLPRMPARGSSSRQ